jgi:hypothetical protein
MMKEMTTVKSGSSTNPKILKGKNLLKVKYKKGIKDAEYAKYAKNAKYAKYAKKAKMPKMLNMLKMLKKIPKIVNIFKSLHYSIGQCPIILIFVIHMYIKEVHCLLTHSHNLCIFFFKFCNLAVSYH